MKANVEPMADRVDTGAVQQEVLRHRAQCVGCRSKLPPRGLAWVHRDASGVEHVVCDTCFRAGTFPEELRPEGYLTASQKAELEARARAEAEAEALSVEAVESVAHSVAQSLAETLARSVEETAAAAARKAREEADAYAAAIANPPEPTVDIAPLEAGTLVGTEALTAAPGGSGATDPVPDPVSDPVPDPTAASDEGLPEPVVAWSASEELFQGPPVRVGDGSESPRAKPRIRDAARASEPDPVPLTVRAGRAQPSDAIGRVLMAAENRGLVWLGPRTTPEGRTVDHVALSPNGVWLVKTEPPATGRIERRDVGDWFTAEPRLYVGDQDRSEVAVTSAADEVSVARALVASPLESLPIYRVLCFADVPPAWIERPFEFQGMWVTWSRHLIEPMLATVHIQRAEVSRLASVLDRILTRA